MQPRKIFVMLIAIGMLLVLSTGLWLATAHPVKAQCGSQASSCKNCHEVQGQKSVNSDGTGWHQSHAFGDFCYLCHAGNNQAVEKDAAHAGMVPPLQDVKAACQSCHVKDYNERAQIYAVKLGIQIGGGAVPAANGGTTESTKSAPVDVEGTPASPQPASGSELVVENQPVINYVEQYNQSVLGKTVINWGNVIVSIMIVIIVIVGGAIIYQNEHKLRGFVSPKNNKAEAELDHIRLEDYPDEIIALLPQIKALNPVGRKALSKLLKNPDAASDLLLSLSRLDPGLIKQMKGLDRESQSLLIALAGE
jgi:hypothetical protein